MLARLDSQTYSKALFIHVILIRKHESDIELAEIVANFPEDLYWHWSKYDQHITTLKDILRCYVLCLTYTCRTIQCIILKVKIAYNLERIPIKLIPKWQPAYNVLQLGFYMIWNALHQAILLFTFAWINRIIKIEIYFMKNIKNNHG